MKAPCTHNEPLLLQCCIQSVLNHTFFDSSFLFFSQQWKTRKENIYDSCFISFNFILRWKKFWEGEIVGLWGLPFVKVTVGEVLLPLIYFFTWKLLYLETEYRLKCDPVEKPKRKMKKNIVSIVVEYFSCFRLQASKQANYHSTSLLSLLFAVVGYLYRKLYTFIFPIIILLSFTRRWELYVRP